ncbi:MAG: NUDIX domain-containing protein [Gammaproteobacteria bacterium]|nr:NUDIX domain-containing protein [Gammaproteobacteria bacterium]
MSTIGKGFGCKKPQPGVAVVIRHDQKILLGRRIKPPMTGSWQLPGGWIHLGESPEQAVLRLLTEFNGGRFTPAQFITYTNNLFDQNTHSLTLYFVTECIDGDQLDLMQSSRCSDWFWADWSSLPQPLFLPLELLRQTGFRP